MSTLKGLCCVGPTPVSSNIAYSVWGGNGHNFHFEAYSDELVKKVMAWQISEPTYFNTALLDSFRVKFRTESKAGVKVSWKDAEKNLAHTTTTVDALAYQLFFGSEVNVGYVLKLKFVCLVI